MRKNVNFRETNINFQAEIVIIIVNYGNPRGTHPLPILRHVFPRSLQALLIILTALPKNWHCPVYCLNVVRVH